MPKESLERILKLSWRKVDIVKRYFHTIPLSGHLHILRLKKWIWKSRLCVRNSAARRDLITSWRGTPNKSSLADKMKSSEIFN